METNQTYQNELGSAMLPFVMRELVDTVMKRKTLPLEDALYYIYSSNLYKALLDENTKLWYSSTLSLYEALEKEKTEQKKVQKDNPKILLFQMFCAENYRETKNISAKETLLLFSNHGVFEFLYENQCFKLPNVAILFCLFLSIFVCFCIFVSKLCVEIIIILSNELFKRRNNSCAHNRYESSEKERKVTRKNSCNLSPGSSLLSDGQRPYLG